MRSTSYGLKMLRALIPFQHRGLTGTREILDGDPCLRSCQNAVPKVTTRKRAPAKLLAIIVGDDSVFTIAQVAPVRVAEKSIIPIIATDPAVSARGNPYVAGIDAPALSLMVMSPSASHFQPEITPMPDKVIPLPGISRTPVSWGVCQRRSENNEAKPETRE